MLTHTIHETERRCADYTFSLGIVSTQATTFLELVHNWVSTFYEANMNGAVTFYELMMKFET